MLPPLSQGDEPNHVMPATRHVRGVRQPDTDNLRQFFAGLTEHAFMKLLGSIPAVWDIE